MSPRSLSHAEARSFYDRFGAKQDLQRFYEDPAIEVLLRHAGFDSATAVVELGCGTGRLAERLLRELLPASASYAGFDISQTMVELARPRVAPWKERARVERVDGEPRLPLIADASCDRYLSTYVLDLLSEDEIQLALRDARRMLAPGGRLCLASLTFGEALPSRMVCRLWTALHSLSPRIVGGCRPLRLEVFTGGWRVLHREVVCRFGICTEVLIAT